MSNYAEGRRRVAIVGSGPAGFYSAELLLKSPAFTFQVDMYERLPFPYGLVRYGVAPDHPKIKQVTRAFDRCAELPGFRFFGGVEVGSRIRFEWLAERYDAIIVCAGAGASRKMNIPGEELPGSISATQFVAWYNGHPGYQELDFLLDSERVLGVGVGNVSADMARILLRDPRALERTDITEKALERLRQSRVREVVLLARGGPEQLKIDVKELRDIAEDENISVELCADQLADARRRLARYPAIDPQVEKRLSLMEQIAAGRVGGPSRARRLKLQFFASPKALLGESRVTGVSIEKNQAWDAGDGYRLRSSGELSFIEAGLVFRAVGYTGERLAGLPFDERAGIIPNERGRVLMSSEELKEKAHFAGVYVAGWIKRGATGLIGTNRPDAAETVERLMKELSQRNSSSSAASEDAALAEHELPSLAEVEALNGLVFTWDDWKYLDEQELALGERLGKAREKLLSVEQAEALCIKRVQS